VQTEEEKVHISTLKKRGDSYRQIAKAINRSEKLVGNCLKLGQKYCTKSKRRRRGNVRTQQIGRTRHEASQTI
jgi:IS30 family transposase